MNSKYIVYFNTKIKATDRNKLTRENYCIPTSEPSYIMKQALLFPKKYYEKNKVYPPNCSKIYYDFPNDVFLDDEHYTKQWVEKHYHECMENFDLNMQFFSSLDKSDFQNNLSRFQKKNRFKEIFDLKEVSGVEGIYILVLDEYKQIYIGKSNDIKKRILDHWRKRKEFDRLIYGFAESSILSIDSFGALDTTRIFYKTVSRRENIDKIEERLVDDFDKKYLLNRVAGGLNAEEDEEVRNLCLLASRKKRKLK